MGRADGDELEQAENRLREARIAIQAFRNRTQIIDPTIQTQAQSGLIGALETQLAEAQIDLQMLLANARSSDPRITQARLRLSAIPQLRVFRTSNGGKAAALGVALAASRAPKSGSPAASRTRVMQPEPSRTTATRVRQVRRRLSVMVAPG